MTAPPAARAAAARATALGIALLAACRIAPADRPPAGRIAPEAGCRQSLAGTWHDGEDASYAYRLEDTGENVFARPFVPELGGPPPPPPEMIIELRRGLEGLAGVVRQTGPFTFPDGTTRTCTVEFAVRVVSCSERRLEMEVEQSGSLGPDCRRTGTEAPDLARHVWIRE